MKRMLEFILLSAGVLGSAGTLYGQEVGISSSAAQIPSAPTSTLTTAAAPTDVQPRLANVCEIHIWPAERFTARSSSLLSAFGVIGALVDASAHANGDAARRGNLASALESQSQAELLSTMDLPALLNAQAATIIKHDTPLDRKTVNKIPDRRALSDSPCYSEVIVADILYAKSTIYGRSLRALFIYRRFGSAKTNPAIYKGWGGNGLKLFPPKEGEDIQAANTELTSVFKANFEEFAKNARRATALASAK